MELAGRGWQISGMKGFPIDGWRSISAVVQTHKITFEVLEKKPLIDFSGFFFVFSQKSLSARESGAAARLQCYGLGVSVYGIRK